MGNSINILELAPHLVIMVVCPLLKQMARDWFMPWWAPNLVMKDPPPCSPW